MCIKAKNYMNNAILKMIRKYSLSETDATRIIKDSFLYEALILYPEETIHDDLDTTVEIIYNDLQLG